MKKLVVTFFAFGLMASFNVNAQENKSYQSGLWSTNIETNIFGCSFDNFRIEKLQVRRYLNDNAALRLSLGFGLDNDKNTSTTDNDDPNKGSNYTISHSTTETTIRSKSFKIGLGYEYHKDVFDRVDIYAGGEIGYAGYFYSYTEKTDTESETVSGSSRTETSFSSTENYFNSTPGGSRNTHSFYISGLAGVDVYFYKNLYIGTELGITYNLKSLKNGYREYEEETITTSSSGKSIRTEEYSSETGVRKVVSTNTSGTTTTTNTYSKVYTDKSIDHSIALFIEPSFHIGIRF